MSKVFEKLIHKRLYDFKIKNKTIHENQPGFQKWKYIEHAILDLYTSITQSVEKQTNLATYS